MDDRFTPSETSERATPSCSPPELSLHSVSNSRLHERCRVTNAPERGCCVSESQVCLLDRNVDMLFIVIHGRLYVQHAQHHRVQHAV
jgi:hypothetical protein